MLRNKLMTACSVAVLTAALYGCSSSSDDGANTQVQDLQDQIAALNAELGEGEELTPEALAALIQEKADAEAALADAMIAHQAALDQAAMEQKLSTGTFDGVPGQFTCTATDNCTVVTDSDGKLVASMNWRFTPMAPLTATVKDPDVAYAYFGWWLDKPEDNTLTHMTEVFAGAVGDDGADVTLAIEGNATYVGPAAGKYATKSYSAGVQTDAAVGHFTASTTLTAKFGDDTDPAGTIGGSVTGFELDDGATPAWSVKLDDAPLTVGNNDFNHTSEATFGPTSKVMGVWEGAFYGAGAADTAPGTVVGTFSAVSDSRRMHLGLITNPEMAERDGICRRNASTKRISTSMP